MAEENSKPETKPELPKTAGQENKPEGAQPSAGKPAVPETKEDKDFAAEAEKKLEEYTKKTEALRKKFDLAGSTGKKKAELLTDRQVVRLKAVAEAKKQEFRNLLAEQKAQRKAMMLGEVSQEMEKIYWPYERIIDYCRGLDKIDEADLTRLEAIMEAMNKLRTNPEAEKLFMKVLSKQPLKLEDYQQIATMLSPVDLEKEIAEGKGTKLFESAQMGAIVGIMDSAQRMELVKTLLKVKTPAENEQILDMFMTAGVVSTAQVTALCEQGKIPEPQRTNLLTRINSGDANKKQQDYQQKVDQLTKVNQGRTGENPVNKAFGAPGLMALTAMWGAAVALVNLKANWDWKKPGESLSNVLTNPWFVTGAVASGASMYGMAKIIDPKATQSLTSRIASTPQEKQAQQAEEKKRIQEEMEVPLKTNPFLLKFLTCQETQKDGQKKSGFSVLYEISSSKLQHGKGGQIALEDKQKTEYDKRLDDLKGQQKEYLSRALGIEQGNKFRLQEKLNAFMAGCYFEGINTDDKLKAYLQKYNQRQGIEAPSA